MLLRRRLLLLFVAIVAAVLALGGLMVLTLRERDDAQQRERRFSVAVERVAQLSTAYADQETGERGFVLGNGNPAFLQPYENGRASARRLVPQLQAALDTPSLRAQLQRVTIAMSTWRANSANPEIALTRSGDSAGASQLVAEGQGKALFDKVRAAQATLTREVQAEESRAQRHLDDVRSRLTKLFAAIVVVAVVGAVLAGWLIRRWVTRPIDQLADEVRRVRGARSTRRSGSRVRPSWRHWPSTSTRCAATSASSSWSRSARDRPSNRARRWCSRSVPSSNR